MYIMNKDCILFRFSKNCVFFCIKHFDEGDFFFLNNNFILYEHFFII